MSHTMIAPPLNQEQIVARLAGATIAPAIVNATTHIDAPSLRYDGTDILARANTWAAEQRLGGSGIAGRLRFLRPSDGAITGIFGHLVTTDNNILMGTPTGGARFQLGHSASGSVDFGTFDGTAFTAIHRLTSTGLAIGTTALAAIERLRVAGGGTPGTPAATDCLFGAGVGRFGGRVRTESAFNSGFVLNTSGGTLSSVNVGSANCITFTQAGITIETFTGGVIGQWVFIHVSNGATIKHETGTGQQFACPGSVDLALTGRGGLVAFWDGARWRVVSTTS